MGTQHHVLSNTSYVSRLLHKTSTRRLVSYVPRYNYGESHYIHTYIRHSFIFKQVVSHKTDPIKRYSIKTRGPLKEKEMLEDEKGKEVRTYSDLFYARRYTYQLSNGEEYSKFKNF